MSASTRWVLFAALPIVASLGIVFGAMDGAKLALVAVAVTALPALGIVTPLPLLGKGAAPVASTPMSFPSIRFPPV